MENFSTTGGTLLPRAANLATLAVVLAATWWSGAQRPSVHPQLGATPAQSVAHGNTQSAPDATLTTAASNTASTTASTVAGTPAPATGTSLWSATTATISRDGLQAVSFQPRSQR